MVFFCCLRQLSNRLPWNDQKVNWCCHRIYNKVRNENTQMQIKLTGRIDVIKGNTQIVFVDKLVGHLSRDHLPKDGLLARLGHDDNLMQTNFEMKEDFEFENCWASSMVDCTRGSGKCIALLLHT